MHCEGVWSIVKSCEELYDSLTVLPFDMVSAPEKKIMGSEKRKFLFFLFNLFNYILRLLNQTIFALKGMILQPFEGTKHHKTPKNQQNFCCIENNLPEKACLSWHLCTP